jgi:HAD superfamily hydrolase (TIGR01549 family)
VSAPVAILDVDGTLVDTNYHHALAWFRAFRQHGIVLPLARIHRHIGMGGDQMVGALAGEGTEEREGDSLRAAETALYLALIEEVEPFRDSRELIVDLRGRGAKVILASSAKADELDHYLDLLDARDVADAWTTSADVEATKPAPDLVTAALEKAEADAGDAFMVGDTPWDCKAAERAGVPTHTVLTGGFSEQELSEAGAATVYSSVSELRGDLDEVMRTQGAATGNT